ncbi:tRNA 2-thiouridine(34) synthase MnmA [Calditerricola satsumensis]|uniref:tRNA-specific 2-thiouridylase MnmA n=1 Tax=Calditerricola satsumensis TaxID=373054 RepID=A0A8J3BFS0_9BACI|nr:tRNA 2-thiouridine(34) synthase MnmA [Calditerricola satsumensis]GGK05903.1 tRNA-specific 2-thiouridylase MnmA [Calditerricola satsumensis]
MAKKVVVAMSGGVDSSVTAALMKQAGYEVIGITMRLYQPDDPLEQANYTGGCCSLDDVYDARRVCEQLGIPHYAVNFKHEFNEKVIAYFEREYKRGRTPNPCIACNIYMKYDLLLQKALDLGADYLATGHYAVREYDEARGRFVLKKGVDPRKDQSYVLCHMTQEQLKHTLFPLGKYRKDQVRQMAKEFGLRVYNKPDSQEICFIPNNDYKAFIQKRSKDEIKEGYIYDTKGNIVGKHKGIPFYTIGQRHGLGLNLGRPVYVVDIIPERNAIVVGGPEDVLGTELVADSVNWIAIPELTEPIRVEAKIRSQAEPAPCTVTPLEDGRVHVRFDEPQRAITPGQTIAFYDGDLVVGGAIIDKRILPHAEDEAEPAVPATT